jgi:hypothetical protein
MPIDKYTKQMQFELACTGLAWSDFVSFNPLMPPEMQLFVKRVFQDVAMIAELETAVSDFLVELDAANRAGPPGRPWRAEEPLTTPCRTLFYHSQMNCESHKYSRFGGRPAR